MNFLSMPGDMSLLEEKMLREKKPFECVAKSNETVGIGTDFYQKMLRIFLFLWSYLLL